MMLKFLLREDMPKGFRKNPNYPELPAAVAFLKQYEGREFRTKSEFKKALGRFQTYLIKHKVPEGYDRRLREGLLVTEVEGLRGVFDVVTISEGVAGQCCFGSFGSEANLRNYIQLQRKARRAQT